MEKKQEIQPIDKTELIWPGKRKEVERVELPFQTIETINLPRGARQESIFDTPAGQKKLIKDNKEQLALRGQDLTWKNRLIWGDNLLIMGSLLKEFAGKINLIYIDPPFATGDDFSFEVQIGDQEITKEPSALEVKAYRDTWGKGMQSYLQMMYDRLVLMKELLADNGSIYVHLDYRVVHYIKLVMDEIFGKENLRNEIVWWYKRWTAASGNFQRMHDTILFYSKTGNYKFNQLFQPLATSTQAVHGDTRRINVFDENGRMITQRTNEPTKGVQMHDVWEIPFVVEHSQEQTGYDTQKPVELVGRIIDASTNEGDLVADFFVGSGTTLAAAEGLRVKKEGNRSVYYNDKPRRWIGCDLGRFAIHTARKRLLDISAKPFVVQNLGKYERHRWVQLNGRYKNYLKFILELYHAEPVQGFTNLHGKKDKAFVRIGAVDAPVTLSEIREALNECKENKIKSLDVLGWEWEMGLHDLIKEEAERYGVKLSTFQIPREVMELNVSDPKVKEDIHFYELAYLEVMPKTEGKRVTITLKDFIIPNPELLPEEVKDKVKNWSDFIDYWAVDWMFNQHEEKTEEDDTFHNMNQRYRTRKEPKLELSMDYEYKKSGKYNVLVKVIDIFGNDTTKLIEVKIQKT